MRQPASLTSTADGAASIGDRKSERASFTPGPWKFEGPLIDGAGKSKRILGWIAHGFPFLELHDPAVTPRKSADELIANAHLIAAAPDMYRALEAVIGEWREGYGLNCVEQVRAALSLARGEKQ